MVSILMAVYFYFLNSHLAVPHGAALLATTICFLRHLNHANKDFYIHPFEKSIVPRFH